MVPFCCNQISFPILGVFFRFTSFPFEDENMGKLDPFSFTCSGHHDALTTNFNRYRNNFKIETEILKVKYFFLSFNLTQKFLKGSTSCVLVD